MTFKYSTSFISILHHLKDNILPSLVDEFDEGINHNGFQKKKYQFHKPINIVKIKTTIKSTINNLLKNE